MPIEYRSGDASDPRETRPLIIVHCCNNEGGWGRGFVLSLSQRWPDPEREYRRCYREEGLLLGGVQLIEVEPRVWVANLIGQDGMRYRQGIPPIRYPAIRKGLQKVAVFAREVGATVQMPKMGAGLAGGYWGFIEGIIKDEMKDLPVVVYDLV